MPTFVGELNPQNYKPVQPPLPQLWAADSRAFWRQSILGNPIDVSRTAALASIDLPISLPGGVRGSDGSVYGQPIQLLPANAPKTPVLDDRRSFWDIVTGKADAYLPLPPVVQREADPGCPFDKHWRAIDAAGGYAYEAWVLRRKPWPFDGFACSDFAVWNLGRSWDSPGQPLGTTAAKVPDLPLTLTAEDVMTGPLGHALFFAMPEYAAAKVGVARGFDGTLPTTYPLRAGERLRLRADALIRIQNAYGANHPCTNLATGLRSHGLFLADKTGTGNPATVKMTQDVRWLDLLKGGPSLRVTDFDVVQQP